MSAVDRRGGRWSTWLAVVSTVCILGWSIPALLMLDKGFAVQDEGSYVLSYRNWHSYSYFVSGSQYFYGPVFEVLGESIPLLRLLRLLMVIGTNAWFAWTFLEWLERQGPTVLPATRWSLALLLTAAGGMSYLWAPLTPGYYDLTADLALALCALMFMALVRAPRPPGYLPLVTGMVCFALVVTKWTAAPVVLLVVPVSLLGLGAELAAKLRYLIHLFLGIAIALTAFHSYAAPIGPFTKVTWQVSRLTAVDNHGLSYLVRVGVITTAVVALGAVVIGAPLWAALVGARIAARRRPDSAWPWLIGGGILTLVLGVVIGSTGTNWVWTFLALVLAGLGAAAIWALIGGVVPVRGASLGVSVVAVLLLVPLLQAAGTNVPPLYIVDECLAMWLAAILIPVAHPSAKSVARRAVVVNFGVVIVAVAIIAGHSTLATPFKTTPLSVDSREVPGLGVRLSPTDAKRYAALREIVGPYIVRNTTPVLTLDQLAGLSYLLGGIPAGSTWTDQWAPTRTAGILELACRRGDLKIEPVLIVNRRVAPTIVQAMARCGFDFPSNYRRLDVPGGPPALTVYVPRGR